MLVKRAVGADLVAERKVEIEAEGRWHGGILNRRLTQMNADFFEKGGRRLRAIRSLLL